MNMARSLSVLPRWAGALLAAVMFMATAIALAPAAHAETSETGPDGQELTVSETEIPTDGATVTVSGSDFRDDVGIYVSVCVIPDEGEKPSPCLGGANMEGDSGASIWVSSNPPPYAEGLTAPFEAGGTFEVDLAVASSAGTTDCLDEDVAPNGCAITTRADHTRDDDRDADILIPISFSDDASSDDSESDDTSDDDSDDSDEAAANSADEAEDTEDEADTDQSEETTETEAAETSDEDSSTFGWGLLIAAIIIGGIAGVSAVVIANKKKRQQTADDDADEKSELEDTHLDDPDSEEQ